MSRPWVFAEEAKGRTRGLFLSDISTKNDCQFEWGGWGGGGTTQLSSYITE
jgi:hypothetical protein